MRAVIVDDEVLVAKNLELLLNRYCPEVIIDGIANTSKAAKALIEDKEPDLVFLDVEIPYANGFELLQSFDQIKFEVIFVTAFDHYAIKAIKYSALDYLLKPIDIEELKTAVVKAQNAIKSRNVSQSLNVLLHNMAQPSAKMQKLSLPTMDGMIFIAIEEISYCRSEGNYTHFYLSNGHTHTATRQIGTYEELLPEPYFCRIHRQFIINVNKVSKYIKGRGGYVVMNDGKVIDVSARKKEDFLNAYQLR